MKYYCGIDFHSRDCFLCVIDDNEKILVRKKLPNDLKMILDQLCQFDSMPIVAVESTLNWLLAGGWASRRHKKWTESGHPRA
jgi:transposase